MNIIKNSLFVFLVSCSLINCKPRTQKHTENQKVNPNNAKEVKHNPIKLEDISDENYKYSIISIKNSLCKYKDTILKVPLEEINFHHLEVLEEEGINTLFYEYSSARPVYFKTIYFNKNYTKVDSLKEGDFNFSSSSYSSTSLKIDKSICDGKIKELRNIYK